MSDRYVTFANQVGDMLKERYPDRDFYVVINAYGHSRPAPVKAVPKDNVIIMAVANFMLRPDLVDRGSSLGTTHRDQFKAWGEVAPHLVWRPNTGGGNGWRWGAPVAPLKQTMKDFELLAEVDCRGIYVDSVWMHWATQGPLYYLMAHLAWDPRSDGEAIMADYWNRAFGPAAKQPEKWPHRIRPPRQKAEHQTSTGKREIQKASKEEKR